MAYIVMAHTAVAYIAMAHTVMAYIVMAHTFRAYIVMAYTVPVNHSTRAPACMQVCAHAYGHAYGCMWIAHVLRHKAADWCLLMSGATKNRLVFSGAAFKRCQSVLRGGQENSIDFDTDGW